MTITRRLNIGERVRKISGASWQGRVVGFYSTKLTPVGYCIESDREPGSVQIYPVAALEPVHPCPLCGNPHDNDLLSDICRDCEARLEEEGSP